MKPRDYFLAILVGLGTTFITLPTDVTLYLHFGVSLGLVWLLYFLSPVLPLAAFITIFAGTYKELNDPIFDGNDMLANLLGIITAMVLIDVYRMIKDGNNISFK